MKGFPGLENGYTLKRYLGKGGCGLVLSVARVSDGKEFAVKVIPKQKISTASSRRALVREVQILMDCDHDGVVGFHDLIEDSKYVYIVLELISGGDLYSALKDRKEGLCEAEALIVAHKMLASLVYLHKRGIAHRDIKLENVMLANGNLDSVKLIDFGLAHRASDLTFRDNCTDFCGTIQYCAPEICSKKPYNPAHVDMWCLGVLLYALLARKLPFPHADRRLLVKDIVHKQVEFSDPVWDSVTPQMKELISTLLSKQGSQRPDAAAALKKVEHIISSTDIWTDSASEVSNDDSAAEDVVRCEGVKKQHNLFDMVVDAIAVKLASN
uniref:Protein kinase domain-containing protein n=1 Tax=Rhodosorus marinus TaxID=101924 RepID=A0A7S3EFT3_9RHOD|mmetsp:Transcript_29098/g.113069  ORF Transcript_29098/g.113069 Transcript_29098/m.113069 type:complete len:326 (+) Transcript_29098:137-1114(+)